MKKVTFSLLLCLAAPLAAAQATDLAGNWKMVGWTLPNAIPIKAHLPTLIFKGKQVSGTAGCNTYMGSYTLSGNSITFSDLGLTRMACGEPVEQQEQAFMQTLSGKTLTVTRVGDSLTLTTKDGYMLNIRRSTLQDKK
ncbi:hypothetical protein Dxin01_04105 [Deinococcus xinjiangensis]|uniref:DUF306 domain-containing protein n=1 Tax=Deinococcus xinjiangensis TaxID=457454 RepID=A0ABP9VJB0_9DEIO